MTVIVIRCCECGKEIDGEPYLFSGNFACESCVRNYYKDNYSNNYIEQELSERRFAASKMLRKKL